MSEYTTYARPYAKALFAFAQTEKTVDAWSSVLNVLSQVIQTPLAAQWFSSPLLSVEELITRLLECVRACRVEALTAITQEVTNLLHLLWERRRILMLPDVASLFQQYCLEATHTLDVQVTAAFALTTAEQAAVCSALERRFK